LNIPTLYSMHPRYQYILGEFRHLYGLPREMAFGYGSFQEDARVQIRCSGTLFFEGERLFPEKPAVWKTWKKRSIPFLFGADPEKPLIEHEDGQWFIHADILASAFYFLGGWQSRQYMKRHRAFRFPYAQSLHRKLGIARLPVVNYYFDILREAAQRAYGFSPRPVWGPGHQMALCLSHDIDEIHSGWLQDGLYSIKNGKPRRALRLAQKRILQDDSWNNIHDLLKLEREQRVHSTYFFLPRKTRFPWRKMITRHFPGFPSGNADYRLEDVAGIFPAVLDAGSEISLHGSVGSHRNPRRLEQDLCRMPGVRGVRFHYLGFDPNRTWPLLEEAGLDYDATLGFAREPGFRYGYAFPFHPYDFQEQKARRVLEIPLHLMDSTLRTSLKKRPEECRDLIRELMDETARFEGCLSVLWHNHYFTPDKFSGWKNLYLHILNEGRRHHALIAGCGEIARRWKDRSSS